MRDGAPVLKSRLVVDDAGDVAAYLKLRAQGVPRGVAIARLQLRWPATSTHSTDWQALTYAGHTVWNVHAERAGGKAANGEKRRPRSEWVIQRNTHEALITTEEAEAILAQMERSLQGRRLRASPLLLTGLVVDAGGRPWHSDGCGFYRLGRGRKIAAARLETAILERLAIDLSSDNAVARIQAALRALEDAPIDGCRLAGLEKRITALTTQIGKTVDLCSQIDDPAPILRRVNDFEHQRAQLVAELEQLRATRDRRAQAASIDAMQVRGLLRRLFSAIRESAEDSDRRAEARHAIAEVVERIELDPLTLAARVHYAVSATADKMASPRGFEPLLSP